MLFVLSFCFFYDVSASNEVYSDKKVGTYEEELAKFPNEYKQKIEIRTVILQRY